MELQTGKRSLLDFQKSLNEQFEKVQNQSSSFDLGGTSGLDFEVGNATAFEHETSDQENLGMSFIYFDKHLNCEVRLLLPLNNLKHILSSAQYEHTYLMRSWIRGFTHFRGDSFSIIDPINLFNPESFTQTDNESRIILFKEKDTLRYGMLCRDISLLDMENLYTTMTLVEKRFEDKIVINIDNKVLNIFKNSNNLINIQTLSSGVSLQSIENKKQPSSLLNLAHIQKYAKIYQNYLTHIERVKKIQENLSTAASVYLSDELTQTLGNLGQFSVDSELNGVNGVNTEKAPLSALIFAKSLFIDNIGTLGILVDVDKFNNYLTQTSPY